MDLNFNGGDVSRAGDHSALKGSHAHWHKHHDGLEHEHAHGHVGDGNHFAADLGHLHGPKDVPLPAGGKSVTHRPVKMSTGPSRTVTKKGTGESTMSLSNTTEQVIAFSNEVREALDEDQRVAFADPLPPDPVSSQFEQEREIDRLAMQANAAAAKSAQHGWRPGRRGGQ